MPSMAVDAAGHDNSTTPAPRSGLFAVFGLSNPFARTTRSLSTSTTCSETPPDGSSQTASATSLDAGDWVDVGAFDFGTAADEQTPPCPRRNTCNSVWVGSMAFIGVYRALYDYAPQSDEELEIKDGDLLLILEKSSEDDWWKCKKKALSDDDDEPEGLIPNNYVEEAKPTHSAKALYDYTKQTDEELSFEEGAAVQVYDETDPDWTLVGRNGEYGFVPALYIKEGAAAAPAPAAVSSPASPPLPSRPAADEPIPGEDDYPGPSAQSNPAAGIAAIIAQKTGGARDDPSPAPRERSLAAPPPMSSPALPSRPQYAPEESEEDVSAPPQPPRPQSQSIPSPPPLPHVNTSVAQTHRDERRTDSPGVVASPPYNRATTQTFDDYDSPQRSPGGFHLYNIHEYISHMGKNKKLPMTLGINIAKGVIMISPEKSRDGPSQEWTAEKLSHYSIEGKHVFIELVRPSKSVDFHAGAKDTAQEIVAMLGEVAGASRAEGLREVLAASAGSAAAGMKTGKMLYEFMAQGDDEVTVAADDEVIVLDDQASDEWWKVRRLKNGKEGVVPSSYVEITGTVPDQQSRVSGLDAARSTVEQNRLEEERLAKEASRKGPKRSDTVSDSALPERGSSLAADSRDRQRSQRDKNAASSKEGQGKAKPNQGRVRTWTDRSGTFKVEAEFIGLREGKIHLHKQNGVKIAVPVAKMAVEDLEYVEKATGASLDEDKPLSDIKRRSTQKAKANGTASRAGASVQKQEEYDWFDFFLQCGVSPQICERYAHSFSKDQMGPENMPDINEKLLRTLGVKEGDILRVMKHLDAKYGRGQNGEQAGGEGGLFSGPGGALRNNTKKGRPAPAVQTNDVVSEDAFKPKGDSSSSPAAREPPTDAKATPLTSAPARQPTSGFDDDAWDVKPARTATPDAAVQKAAPTPEPPTKPAAAEPPKPRVNDNLASLDLASPPLQPTPTAAAAAPVVQSPTQQTPAQQQQQQPPQPPPGANADIFNKIASLAPAARQRPQPPAQSMAGGGGMLPPPARASSAPGFQVPPQQTGMGFGVGVLQAQLTGYGGGQYAQQPQPQPTGFGVQPQPTGFQQPQQTGVQAMQANYPPLQPQPTGMAFRPQSQFGQAAQQHHYGQAPPMPQYQQQQQYQQQLINGAQTGSPFADPTSGGFNVAQASTGFGGVQQQTGFQQQQTGFPQHQQPQPPQFNYAQPTGANTMNGTFGQPAPSLPQQLPPQQTGGVLGVAQPLTPQKTGPPPPVRFGVTQGGLMKGLVPQRTGRADLGRATPQNPFGF